MGLHVVLRVACGLERVHYQRQYVRGACAAELAIEMGPFTAFNKQGCVIEM